jgi:hypothetical protein
MRIFRPLTTRDECSYFGYRSSVKSPAAGVYEGVDHSGCIKKYLVRTSSIPSGTCYEVGRACGRAGSKRGIDPAFTLNTFRTLCEVEVTCPRGPLGVHRGRYHQFVGRNRQLIWTTYDTAFRRQAGTVAAPPPLFISPGHVPCDDGRGKRHSHAGDAR